MLGEAGEGRVDAGVACEVGSFRHQGGGVAAPRAGSVLLPADVQTLVAESSASQWPGTSSVNRIYDDRAHAVFASLSSQQLRVPRHELIHEGAQANQPRTSLSR